MTPRYLLISAGLATFWRGFKIGFVWATCIGVPALYLGLLFYVFSCGWVG